MIAFCLTTQCLTVGLVACERQFDMKGLEDNIKEKFAGDEDGPKVSGIKCPDKVVIKKDATFQCAVELDPGYSVTADVKITDGAGSFAWETFYKKDDFEKRYTKMLKDKGVEAKSTECDKDEVRGEAKLVCKLTLASGEKITHNVEVTGDSIKWESVAPAASAAKAAGTADADSAEEAEEDD